MVEDVEMLEFDLHLSWEIVDLICEKYDIDFDDFLNNIDDYEDNPGECLLLFQIEKIGELIDKIENQGKH